MDFDHYTITVLMLRPDAPQLTDDALDALQDNHMAHLADLHDAGILLAAGPLTGNDDRQFRGLSIWRDDPHRVRDLLEQHPDPGVAVGRYAVAVLPWMVPTGAMSFAHTRFPRSMADVHGGDGS